jgi:peptidoglycan/LPS O-acetylase OafA/YrhL
MRFSEHDRHGPTGYRVEIESLRALSVLAVLLSHWWSGFAYPINWGMVGVYVFFVISGYVISSSLMNEQARSRGKIDIGAFYLRRAIRICPAYFLLILYMYLSGGNFGTDGISWHLVFASDFLPFLTQKAPIPPHFWSLSVEQQFYLFWPALFLFFTRRAFLWACLVLIAVSVGSRLYFITLGNNYMAALFFLSSNLDCLAAGGLLAAAERGVFRLSANVMRAIGSVGVIALGLIVLVSIYGDYQLDAVFTRAAVAAIACWILFELQANRRFASAVSVQPLLLIGKLSYGIYLYHLSVGYWVADFVDPTSAAFPFVAGIVTLAIAFASWHLMEQPLIKLGKWVAASRWRRATESFRAP